MQLKGSMALTELSTERYNLHKAYTNYKIIEIHKINKYMESGYMFKDRKIQDATSSNLINNFFKSQ